ncbi:hypothetical protein MBM_08439 [Drepanopeziza brunnea f. sp. 'multigermtubi' MB_m1]|uniref:Uncharacterized protein n=1 Tax=Marssonina brunnea f. sp. multigermtubi (strain MB_m1) TaxID=1072389 RepID=K1WKE2_MARBU|nr:uncharacterized protein MBM_08439 [Drepanopeziza brunnea f. sp. 'multigermtubi' MB_m1]EKD13356.1 hypothetical protein MBM_08439 [Drepanopeziza brunnea f. sp. 'multigermtubi' MB_m1]
MGACLNDPSALKAPKIRIQKSTPPLTLVLGLRMLNLLATTPKRSTVSGVLQIADANTSFGAMAPNSAPSPSLRSFARMSGFPSYATHQDARLRAPVKKADKKKANLEIEDADFWLVGIVVTSINAVKTSDCCQLALLGLLQISIISASSSRISSSSIHEAE